MQNTTRKRTKRKVKKPQYSKRARKLQKELLLSLCFLVISIFLIIKFHSSPIRYKVVVYHEDQRMEVIQYYTDFKVAKNAMQEQIAKGAHNPAVLLEDDTILAIRYGVVNFRTKTCGENTGYVLESSQRNGYTNGCYGADGAYLETDDSGTKVKFKQSGAIGWVALQDVQIINYEDKNLVASINQYAVDENNIQHQGTSDMSATTNDIVVNLGENRIQLATGTYFSYDGHYFYKEFPTMIDDYRSNTYANSVNKDTPFYNYFQYLSHRTKSSYVSKELNWYISTYLGYNEKPTTYPPAATQSQLYDEGYSFTETQNSYGVNSLMMLALAINESGFGRSQISIEKNNLFGHAAYDNSPSESASGYSDVAASIKTHASIFLNSGYLNPCDQLEEDSEPKPSTCNSLNGNRYAGGFFGDKASGLNVYYASDPYWGEKAAQYYYQMDQVLGGTDTNRYTIKVLKEDIKNAKVYSLPNTGSNVLYLTPSYDHYAFVLIDEIEGEEVEGSTTWYKLQSDAILNSNRSSIDTKAKTYNFQTDVVYMPSIYFQ